MSPIIQAVNLILLFPGKEKGPLFPGWREGSLLADPWSPACCRPPLFLCQCPFLPSFWLLCCSSSGPLEGTTLGAAQWTPGHRQNIGFVRQPSKEKCCLAMYVFVLSTTVLCGQQNPLYRLHSGHTYRRGVSAESSRRRCQILFPGI